MSATDRIILERLAIFAHHGVLPEEQKTGQRFFVSLDCELDLRRAGETDDLADSVNYAELAGRAAATMLSRLFLVLGAAPVLAPTLGGELLRFTSWRGIFAVLAVYGLLLLAVDWKTYSKHPAELASLLQAAFAEDPRVSIPSVV